MKRVSNRSLRAGWLAPRLAIMAAACMIGGTLGCGMAGSPQPPSLHLPRAIHDLTAARAGSRVALHWNTPDETTDRLRIHQAVGLRICRQPSGGACTAIATISAAPGDPAAYTDVLPEALTTGPLRPFQYKIFALNKHGRSAGPSNPARTLGGEAPPPIEHLAASETERGVVLRWQALPGLAPDVSVQLQRTLLTPPPAGHTSAGTGLPSAAEPAEQTLRVPPSAGAIDLGRVLDTGVEFNRKYRYVAVRVLRRKAGAPSIQISSSPSAPVFISTRDIFPPATPAGLAAIPVSAAQNNGRPEVDLSWSSNSEPDLAGYLVTRREIGSSSPAQQIAPENAATPLLASAFQDIHVQPGRTYAYSVVAVDNAGNRSRPSAEVAVTVPRS